MRDGTGAYRCSVRRPEEREHLGDLGVDGRIVLKWILKNGMRRHGLDYSVSGWGQLAGTCECGNEHSDFIKCREYF